MICPKCGSFIEKNGRKCNVCGYTATNNYVKTSSDDGKIGCGCAVLIVVVIIITIFVFKAINKDDNNTVSNQPSSTQTQQNMPDYITAIKNNPPPGYNTSVTVGQAFERYFATSSWTTQYGALPRVCYTGTCNNPDGTTSTATVTFIITNITGNEFYYQVENINVDGIELNTVFMGFNSFWQEILSKASYK